MRISIQKAFILLLVLVYWSPFDALFYLVGPAALLFLFIHREHAMVYAGNREVRSANLAMVAFICVFTLSSLVNFHSFNNMLWAFLSYGAALAVFPAAANLSWTEEHFRFLLKLLIWTTLVQIPLGYFQMIQGHGFAALNPFNLNMGAGDYFAGTTFDRSNANTVALKMSTTFFLVFPFWERGMTLARTSLMGLLTLGWILPSVMHSIVAGMGAYFFRQGTYALKPMLRLKMSKGILTAVIVGVSVLAVLFWIQRDNIRYVTGLAARVVGDENLAPRKVKYIKNTFDPFLEESPAHLVIGCGPGNYSSRAAAIVSGEFLLRQPSFIPVTPSQMAEKYVIPLWNREILKRPFSDGVANTPYSTWISVFAETGIIGLAAFAWIFVAIWKRIRLQKDSPSPFIARVASGSELLLLYCLGLFFLDDWFEYPAFMGILMLIFGMFMSVRLKGADVDRREQPFPGHRGSRRE